MIDAGAKKQKRLEERMRHEMEHGRLPCAHAQGEKHVTDLAHGGVGQHALDIVLRKRAESGEQQRSAPTTPRRFAPPAPAKTGRACARSGKRQRSPWWPHGGGRWYGVGPAMASGNQTCNGSCADLPTAPPSSRSAAATA
jgi:hypothetical protein